MDTFDRIATSVEWLATSAAPLDLAALSTRAGLSPAHFQRTFQRLVGVSPLRFRQVLQAEAARAALQRSRSVMDAAWDAGLSGPGRLHDTLLRVEQMTPGELKAGPALRWTVAQTSLGPLALAATTRGLCGASFDGLEAIRARWPGARLTRDDAALAASRAAIERGLAGQRPAAPLALVLQGTDLQLAVWRALLEIPEGELVTYAWLAARVDRPTATRAVAGAVGQNPIACLIPCHRVIRGTGALGGYRWGLGRKAALLARELEAR